jgi:hypothetical protein
VAPLDVTDLVSQHTRQLVHAPRGEDGSTVEVDVAPGNSEGVEARVHDDPEAVDEGLGLHLAHDRLPQAVHHSQDDRIVDDRELLLHLRVEGGAQLTLLLDAHRAEVEGVEAFPVVLDTAEREDDQPQDRKGRPRGGCVEEASD